MSEDGLIGGGEHADVGHVHRVVSRSARAAYMADLCFEVASADDLLARTNREPGIGGRTSGWCS